MGLMFCKVSRTKVSAVSVVVLAGEVGGSVGRTRHDRSGASWPESKHGQNRPSSGAGKSKLGRLRWASTQACNATRAPESHEGLM